MCSGEVPRRSKVEEAWDIFCSQNKYIVLCQGVDFGVRSRLWVESFSIITLSHIHKFKGMEDHMITGVYMSKILNGSYGSMETSLG